MPYINSVATGGLDRSEREFLDPYVEKIVNRINQELDKTKDTGEDVFDAYNRLIKFVWIKLGAYLYFCMEFRVLSGRIEGSLYPSWMHQLLFPKNVRKFPEKNPIDLENLVVLMGDAIMKLDKHYDQKGVFAGEMNYCATQIALLAWPEKRYRSMSLFSGICQRVGFELLRLFPPTSAIGDQIAGVFIDHIPAEFYRRVVVRYEEEKILDPKAGDVSGYMKWV